MYWLRRLLLLLPGRRAARERELQERTAAPISSLRAIGTDRRGDARARPSAISAISRERRKRRAQSGCPAGTPFAGRPLCAAARCGERRCSPLVAVLSLGTRHRALRPRCSRWSNTVVLKPLSYREPGRLRLCA